MSAISRTRSRPSLPVSWVIRLLDTARAIHPDLRTFERRPRVVIAADAFRATWRQYLSGRVSFGDVTSAVDRLNRAVIDEESGDASPWPAGLDALGDASR